MADKESLEANHTSTVDQLEKQIRTLEGEMRKVMKANNDEEATLRKEFKKVSNEYENNMKQYDFEVNNQTIDNRKCTENYDDTMADL